MSRPLIRSCTKSAGKTPPTRCGSRSLRRSALAARPRTPSSGTCCRLLATRARSSGRVARQRLPSASPHLVTGIKLAVAYSVIGIVAGEFILSTAGIGKRIAFGYQDFDNRTMYGMLLLLLMMVMAVNGALSLLEKRLHHRFGQQ